MKTAIWWTVATLLMFLAVEGAIFRSGWYIRYLEPTSSAGNVEYQLYWLHHTPRAKVPEVMIIGDSRMAEGFSATLANSEVVNRIHFWNLSIGGMTPRDWYYMIRDADPGRNRFAAIVLEIDNYSDEDTVLDVRDSIADLSYLIGRLRLSDCWDFAMSMHSIAYRQTALVGCVFKGLTLRRDVHEFLQNMPARLESGRAQRESGLGWVNGYTGLSANLSGLSIDPVTRVIHYPPGLTDAQKGLIANRVNPFVPADAGVLTNYRRLWLGGILDLYRNSPTRIVLLQIPRSPLPYHSSRIPPRFIQSVAGRPHLKILPADRFSDMERPDLFGDGLHLNSVGRKIFSERLADDVAGIVGHP
jgi:hypothetical protein